jgi:hypothetical protein
MADKLLSEMDDDELAEEIAGYEFMRRKTDQSAQVRIIDQVLITLYGEARRRSIVTARAEGLANSLGVCDFSKSPHSEDKLGQCVNWHVLAR